jgi:phospholipase C
VPLPSDAGGIAGPVGLGFRVPMLVISPWSRGGWVASETFDHTSVIRFAERLFGVREPQISDWRRRTVGDLTSALRFRHPDRASLARLLPELPDTSALIALEEQEIATLPPPQVPAVQTVPHQEPGPRRPHTF